MRSVQYRKHLGFGLLCLLSGCYHYGYSPYGYPGPVSYPVAPSGGTYMTPSPSYGTPSYGSPTYVPGGGGSSGFGPTPLSSPSPTPSVSPSPSPTTPNWQVDPNTRSPANPARPYEPGPADRAVPNPTDDEQGFGAAPGAMISPPGSPFVNTTGMMTGSPGAVVSRDPAASPVRSVSSGNTVAARATKLATEGRKPFGFDARNYTYLRGFLEFDPADQRWIIMYSSTPETSDRHGGSITLADHPLLAHVKPDDHVMIEGHLDQSSFDVHGKPMYRIEKMVRLK